MLRACSVCQDQSIATAVPDAVYDNHVVSLVRYCCGLKFDMCVFG